MKRYRVISNAARLADIESDYYNYGAASFAEISLHNANSFTMLDLRGQGMQYRIA